MSEQTKVFAEDDFGTPLSKNEQMAERVTSLAVLFMSASAPLSLTEVTAALYTHLSKAAAEKAFKRDRSYLAECGISIISVRDASLGDVYMLDKKATFADDSALTHDDAMAIQSICAPYLHQPDFPYREDLRMALAKIHRVFTLDTATALATSTTSFHNTTAPSPMIAKLHACFVNHCGCYIEYRNAAGTHSTRKLALLGLFSSRGISYFVGASFSSDTPNFNDIRIFREDRLQSVVPLSTHYTIPASFSVKDYLKLPFQYGEEQVKAVFFVPSTSEQTTLAQQLDKTSATYNQQLNELVLSINPNYLHEAARWALANAFTPTSPDTLVDAYITLLKEASHNEL